MLERFAPTSVLRGVLLLSLAVAAYSMLAVWKQHSSYSSYLDLPTGLEAAVSLVIGLFLAFRTNRAFDRWWEARTLWGKLVNNCRNLAVKTNNLVTPRDPSFRRFGQLLKAFPTTLRDHLRQQVDYDLLQKLIAIKDGQHAPAMIVNEMYALLADWKRQGRIEACDGWMLDKELRAFLEVCGACERIRNTPIVISYRVFLNHAITVFLLTLPWSIVRDLGSLTVPVVFLTSYFMIAAEGIAEHIENPFETGGDGLTLDRICEGIQSSVDDVFSKGEQP